MPERKTVELSRHEEVKRQKTFWVIVALTCILITVGIGIFGISLYYIGGITFVKKDDNKSLYPEKGILPSSKVGYQARVNIMTVDLGGDRIIGANSGYYVCKVQSPLISDDEKLIEEQRGQLEALIKNSHPDKPFADVIVGTHGFALKLHNTFGNDSFWTWPEVFPATKATVDDWLVKHNQH